MEKKQSSKIAYFNIIIELSLNALTCPYGPKLKIHVENWDEELFVISTLCGWHMLGIRMMLEEN